MVQPLRTNVSLQSLNTFGFDVRASYFSEVRNYGEFEAIRNVSVGPYLILGGGSNICFTGDVAATVLHNQVKGVELVRETDERVWVRIGGGENWHDTVLYCINQNWGGLENLSLIPGSVGAAPIQNIGAYGVELKDVFDSLEAWHLETGEKREFEAAECQFGYRDSYFKREGKGKWFIAYVTLCLSKTPHTFHLGYGTIRETIAAMEVKDPDIQSVSQAVITIRKSKLPDPAVLGNAGSFFKNPVIYIDHFEKLQQRFPGIPSFPGGDGLVKVPAGWLIEQCGWKGKREGAVGCHKDQALVLVHYGGGSGGEILQLCHKIQRDVKSTFGIDLETEVNIF
jgi:UDP-N-acetylmuramate dehydrogenase